MLITNHTFSNLVLRPNGVNPTTIGPDGLPVGDAPDEAGLKRLGDRMAAQNGYVSQHGWELYDTPRGPPRTGRTAPPTATGTRSRSGPTSSTRRSPR